MSKRAGGSYGLGIARVEIFKGRSSEGELSEEICPGRNCPRGELSGHLRGHHKTYDFFL